MDVPVLGVDSSTSQFNPEPFRPEFAQNYEDSNRKSFTTFSTAPTERLQNEN